MSVLARLPTGTSCFQEMFCDFTVADDDDDDEDYNEDDDDDGARIAAAQRFARRARNPGGREGTPATVLNDHLVIVGGFCDRCVWKRGEVE